jgi:hypothetical protein
LALTVTVFTWKNATNARPVAPSGSCALRIKH